MKHLGKYKIPEYAICAIEYGDFSGLSDEDEQNVNEFLERECPNGCIVYWHSDDEDNEPYFCSYPEFGLAATVVEADFYEP